MSMEEQAPSLRDFGSLRRRAVSVSDEQLIKKRPLLADRPIPMLIEPGLPGLNIAAWAASNRALVDELLLEHRALLFRNFDLGSVADFDQFVRSTSTGERLEYKDRSSPRHEVGDHIYTSTDYPANERIFLHNEGTYWLSWPLKIYFCCLVVPEKGGETPIADCRRIYQRIPPEIRQRFIDKKVLYVRNYNDGFGLPWQTSFQATDRDEVTEYCRGKEIECEWKEGDRLRTRQIREAVATHPVTGEQVWFNHATFFHVSTLEPDIRRALLAEFAEEDLPYNTYYGDGSSIEADVLETLREIYRQEKIVYPWRRGDVLMLDNMTIAHAREPYVGDRKIVVGMAEPCVRDAIPAA